MHITKIVQLANTCLIIVRYKPQLFIVIFSLFRCSMAPTRRNKKPPPEGWELIEPTIEELNRKMREAETDPHEGKRKVEAEWPIFRIHHKRSRFVYDLYYKRKAITKELYDYCIKEKIADGNLIAKWKKQGYENLCCLRCIQSRDTNFGTNCICRVPKAKLEEGKNFTLSVHTSVDSESVHPLTCLITIQPTLATQQIIWSVCDSSMSHFFPVSGAVLCRCILISDANVSCSSTLRLFIKLRSKGEFLVGCNPFPIHYKTTDHVFRSHELNMFDLAELEKTGETADVSNALPTHYDVKKLFKGLSYKVQPSSSMIATPAASTFENRHHSRIVLMGWSGGKGLLKTWLNTAKSKMQRLDLHVVYGIRDSSRYCGSGSRWPRLGNLCPRYFWVRIILSQEDNLVTYWCEFFIKNTKLPSRKFICTLSNSNENATSCWTTSFLQLIAPDVQSCPGFYPATGPHAYLFGSPDRRKLVVEIGCSFGYWKNVVSIWYSVLSDLLRATVAICFSFRNSSYRVSYALPEAVYFTSLCYDCP
ncbi:bud site selection protein 31 [Clonorchis sinensis]|uniref:Protein BUD31 homolog n=1 Tax=Clonorchis sinensis TaxID=79923 RepID=G7YVG7_CLOSI|nr:bud site selection protein 31 [Clonorchis sinensis]